jgi:hypothetical protein
MRILVLTLMMSFLSHSSFGAETVKRLWTMLCNADLSGFSYLGDLDDESLLGMADQATAEGGGAFGAEGRESLAAARAAEAKEAEVSECSICLNGIQDKDNKRQLRCCHIFHRQCIERWLGEHNQNTTCPSCRSDNHRSDSEFQRATTTQVLSVLQEGLRDGNQLDPNLLLDAAENGQTAVQALLDRGANIHQADQDGMTALIRAAENGRTQALQVLIDRGADVNHATPGGWTALIKAAESGHTQTVQALLDRGANIHQADQDGMTALTRAEESGHIATVQALIEAKEMLIM